MQEFDESRDDDAPEAALHDALEAGLELGSDPEELWRSLIADEEYPRYWSENVWSHGTTGAPEIGALLFEDQGSEAELCNELRLSELWGFCESGCLAMDEFFELSALITEVLGLPGCLCADCDMLGRPNVRANWALATTNLCRAHLRFRLGHVRIDGGTSRR
jgi:hypothetical protein